MCRLLAFLLSTLCFAGPALAQHENDTSAASYELGHGWQVPGTGFRLGGYSTVELQNDKHQPWSTGISDLSLIVTWEGDGKLKLFSESNLENALTYEQGSLLTSKHTYLELERLYADYLYSEHVNLRVGKYLTPIGRWNVIHASPLVWTTSRPLITEETFPTNATGAMLYGTLPTPGHDIDYSVFTALGKDWRTDPKINPFKQAYGLHINLPTSSIGEFGFSYASFQQEGATEALEGIIGEHKNLIGFDYFWTQNRYELTAELAYRFTNKRRISEEKGLFVQGVAPLSERWYAIGRYEWYNKVGPAPAMQLGVLGLAMHLTPAMIFKAEYSSATNNHIQAPEGLFTSFSVLF